MNNRYGGSHAPETRQFVAVIVISDLEFGGAQRQVIELANHMDPRKFCVHVCSLADYVPLADRLDERESRLHIVRKRHKFDFTVVPKLRALFRKLRADVVHTFLFDADFFGRLGAALAGTPAVIGSERNCYDEPKARNLIAWRLTQRFVSLTIANSNAGADFNSRLLKQPRSAYRVVHNGVDVERFTPRDGSALKAELGIRAEEKVVGIFGSFKPQKNHGMFLKAAKRILETVPNARFLLVGDELYLGMSDSAEWKKRIHCLVDELGLRDRCLFPGNREDVERYYSVCDVTVLPSLFEGTPNVALESMACGVPVVASDVSDNAYVIPNGRVGYVVALDDEEALANSVTRLLLDEDLRRRMSKEARRWALKEFSCERLAEKTAAVYNEALRLSR